MQSSYDSVVRIFDRRHAMRPLFEHNAGGGLWRVRWHPTLPSELLLACMHDGFKVLAIDYTSSTCVLRTRYDAHGTEALAYGIDWGKLDYNNRYFAYSCSFYNHQLRSWLTT